MEGGHGTALLLVADKHTAALDVETAGQILDLAKLGELSPDLGAGDPRLVVEGDGVEAVVVWQDVGYGCWGQLVVLG